MRLSWIVRVDPNSISNVFIRDTQRQSLEWCEHTPRNTKHCWQPPEARRCIRDGFPPPPHPVLSGLPEEYGLPAIWCSFDVSYQVNGNLLISPRFFNLD
jgi:hypothetical protein